MREVPAKITKSHKIRIVAGRRFWRFLLVNQLPLSIMAVHVQYRATAPLKIFAPDSATPVLAAARLQRWPLLSSYQHEIEFKPSAEVASSDALSRLPLQYRKDASVEDKIFKVPVVQLRKHPVSVLEIARQTARHPVFAKALAMTQNGWPVHFCTTPELKPFLLRKDELSVEQGCLMWGLRTITPPPLQKQQPMLCATFCKIRLPKAN